MKTSRTKRAAASAEATETFGGYVVCVGASAGGLDALESFFAACPARTGAAFVVIQHLSPDHKSMMCNLLSRHTAMPVAVAEDDMRIEPDRVYLIPPGAVMHVTRGHLHLTPKSGHGLTLPIDIFLCSLAEVYGPRAVGIILSGTGTDGSRGARAINAAGGLLLVQEPETSKFDGMPRSAIATGLVDAVLPADKLPARLLAHIDNPLSAAARPAAPVMSPQSRTHDALLAEILQRLHQIGGIDFSNYKPATIVRRIQRRMQIRHTPELSQYLELLDNDRGEAVTLRRETLISVTSFFRDPDTFAVLAERVIDPLVASKKAGDTIRVWAAGVATGEEAYSIAMLILESCERQRRMPNLKIFATDVDQQTVESAAAGQYPESAAVEIAPERLERFFMIKDASVIVKNDLRQCIVFARHNLLADPPFTKMDLVVCRNTLIYFKAAAQERVLRTLLYALNRGGALLLGSSESVGAASEGLQTVSAKHKIFRRVGAVATPVFDAESAARHTPSAPRITGAAGKVRVPPVAASAADNGIAALLAAYAPPAVIVNETHEVIHLFGDVNPYLLAREGAASLQLARMLPDTLTPVASALVFKSVRDQEALVSDPVEVELRSGQRRWVRLSTHPLAMDSDDRLTLLCFEAVSGSPAPARESVDVSAETFSRIQVLERELAATRESLQATIEELETSNEELQATNEELMASNEELQSSNEELQSLNEELNTVNAEYQEKMHVLNRLNADLNSMARASGVATVFVDAEVAITRFSPDAMTIFKLREGDLGRPLDDIVHILDYPALMDDLRATLSTGRMVEREVATHGGQRIFLVRILPHAVPSAAACGAVASFIDVTAFHDARRLQAILDALPEHIAVLDATGTIRLVNAAWRKFARANGDAELAGSGVGVNYLQVCRVGESGDGASAEAAARGLRHVLEGSLPVFSHQYPCHSPTEQRWFVMNAAPVSGPESGAVVSHVNITAWRQRSEP